MDNDDGHSGVKEKKTETKSQKSNVDQKSKVKKTATMRAERAAEDTKAAVATAMAKEQVSSYSVSP